MLYPTSGSRLFIASAPVGASACDWVEIGETASIGFLGLEWDVQTADVMDHCGGDPSEIYEKGVLRRPEIQLIMGNDP